VSSGHSPDWLKSKRLGFVTPALKRASASRSSGEWNDAKMTRTELIIQLLKVAIALAFGAYFVWWSLQVLDRLTPEYDTTAVVARAS
jgi:hypothetical protein